MIGIVTPEVTYIGGVGGGAYMCHRCGSSGSWYDYKRRATLGVDSDESSVSLIGSTTAALQSQRIGRGVVKGPVDGALNFTPMPDQTLVRSYASQLMENPANAPNLRYLMEEMGLAG